MQNTLFSMRDESYAAFQRKLLPTLAADTIIGVRTPQLKALAKQAAATDEARSFLRQLPHTYFDENQLHAFLLCNIKDFDECLRLTDAFLPYVDNWATCDQLSPPVFAKYADRLLPHIDKWLQSERVYTVRFGIEALMRYFTDERFRPEYPAKVAEIRSDEYYINMMIAWYFATALAKQYDAVLPYITEHRLPVWVNNKAVQKAVESRRITEEQKRYLRQFRLPSKKV